MMSGVFGNLHVCMIDKKVVTSFTINLNDDLHRYKGKYHHHLDALNVVWATKLPSNIIMKHNVCQLD